VTFVTKRVALSFSNPTAWKALKLCNGKAGEGGSMQVDAVLMSEVIGYVGCTVDDSCMTL
jgi:hypothetical protein